MTVNWNRIYQELDIVRRNHTTDFSLDEAAQKQQLLARADLLARQPAESADSGEQLEVLTFRLGDEVFAIELDYIQTVYPPTKVTPVPCTPSFIQGIIHVHGKLYSVINLRKFFEIAAHSTANTQAIIILHNHNRDELAVSIDEIITMRSIALTEIQPALSAANSIRVDYIRGITNDPLVIIDAPRILTDQRLVVDEEVAN